MPYPVIYDVTYSYTGFQQAQGDNSFPGTQIDADIAGLQASVSNLAVFTQGVMRSDGSLQNGVVTYDSLSPALQTNGIAGALPWSTGVKFGVGAPVVQASNLYRCLIEHTSGVFATDLAAGKWVFVTALNPDGIIYLGPGRFGIAWDGVTDDTAGWQSLATASNAAGGGSVIVAPPGKTSMVWKNANGVPTSTLMSLSVSGVSFFWNGSKLTTDQTAFSSSDVNAIFRLDTGVVGFESHGLNFSAAAWAALGLNPNAGPRAFYVANAASKISLFNSVFNGGRSFLEIAAGSWQTQSPRASQIQIIGADISNTYYGINGQGNGDKLFARGVSCNNVGRSVFPWNVSQWDVEVESNHGGPFNDVLIKTYCDPAASAAGNSTADIRVKYRNSGRQNATASQSLVGIEFHQNTTTPTAGSMRNIHLDMDVDRTANGQPVGISTWKFDSSGAVENTVRGYVLDNLVISGMFQNYNDGNAALDLFNAVNGGFAGETLRNIILRDLNVQGSNTSITVNAAGITRNFIADNLISNQNLNTSNVGPGVARYRNVTTANVSNDLVSQAIILQGASQSVITGPAVGSPTVTLGSSSGTPAVTATAPLAISAATGNLTFNGTQVPGTTTNDNALAGNIGEYVSSQGTNNSATVTISNGSPGIVSLAAHGYNIGSPVNFTTTGALPTGLTVGTNYYVCSTNFTANSFTVATSVANALAGIPVNTSSAGSGVHTAKGNLVYTTAASGTVIDVTGMTLPAGDWEVSGVIYFVPASTTLTTYALGSVTATDGALDLTQGRFSNFSYPANSAVVNIIAAPMIPSRFSLAAPTTIFLAASWSLTTTNGNVYGVLRARRVR